MRETNSCLWSEFPRLNRFARAFPPLVFRRQTMRRRTPFLTGLGLISLFSLCGCGGGNGGIAFVPRYTVRVVAYSLAASAQSTPASDLTGMNDVGQFVGETEPMPGSN